MYTPIKKQEPSVYDELRVALRSLSKDDLHRIMQNVNEDVQEHERRLGPKEDASMRMCQILVHKEVKSREEVERDLEREFGFHK